MDYKVVFIKLEKEKGFDKERNEKYETVTSKVLGTFTIDDSGCSSSYPLATKAFRHAPEALQLANKLILEPLK